MVRQDVDYHDLCVCVYMLGGSQTIQTIYINEFNTKPTAPRHDNDYANANAIKNPQDGRVINKKVKDCSFTTI